MASSTIIDTFVKDDIEKVIGLPPSYLFEPDLNGDEKNLTLGSMAVMAMYPAYPSLPEEWTGGIQLYSLDYDTGLDRYKKILLSADIEFSSEACLYVAFQNDASISESFSVEYGESKFEEIGNMAGSNLTELRYLTGAKGVGDIGKKLGEKMSRGGMVGQLVGGMVGGAGSLVDLAGGAFEKLTGSMGITKLTTGSKIDFPQMWKGSGYSPSYSVSVRLYNPAPSSDEAHRKYLIEPLAKLLAFVMPLSDSSSTFTFPVLCSVTCPGLFKVKAGYVSSIDIIKGGDANNISYVQRPGMIDIKLTINDLYNTMIAEDPDSKAVKDRFRPLFGDYIDHLMNSKANIGKIPTIETPSPFSGVGSSVTGTSTEATNEPASRLNDYDTSMVDRLSTEGIVL